jgi:hypothetical protein
MTDISRALASVLSEDDINVRIVPLGANLDPRETRAVRTLERMLREHGPHHVRLVLSLLVQSTNNATELVSPNLTAVSRELIAHPDWADISIWFEELDAMPLAAIRRLHLGDIKAHSIPDAMGVRLYARLARRFRPIPPQLDIFGGD